jgi:hypothetical protein
MGYVSTHLYRNKYRKYKSKINELAYLSGVGRDRVKENNVY